MERSIFFFLKIHISAPGERNCPNFFFYGSFPIIFSCYKWVLSRLGPLHGQNWRNVSKKCLFGCPKPKSLKMTNIAPFPQPNFAKWFWFLTIFQHFLVYFLCWKNPKSMIFCSRVPEQLRSRLVIFSDFGLGQPKRHFFDTFLQFWPWRGPKRDKNHL